MIFKRTFLMDAEEDEKPHSDKMNSISASVQRWWPVVAVVVSIVSGTAGALIGATLKVADYDNRLNLLTAANLQQADINTNLAKQTTQDNLASVNMSAALSARITTLESTRMNALELSNSQLAERTLFHGRAISDLQLALNKLVNEKQNGDAHISDRMDLIRDAQSTIKETQASMAAQLSFLYQHPTPASVTPLRASK
jgi:hypothetical protein